MTYDEMRDDITSGLIGDGNSDLEFLLQQKEKYRDNACGLAIIRECATNFLCGVPEEKQEDLAALFQEDSEVEDDTVKSGLVWLRDKDVSAADNSFEESIRKFEESHRFEDSPASAYFSFDGPMEKALYKLYEKPEKEIMQTTENISALYLSYAAFLREQKNYADAEKALEKARKWNPASVMINLEMANAFSELGKFDQCLDALRRAMRYAYTSNMVADCFFYAAILFINNGRWEEARGFNTLCLHYNPSSGPGAMELRMLDIHSNGPKPDPSKEELEELVKTYGFPFGADPNVIELSYDIGMHAYGEGDDELASLFLGYTADLTDDDEVNGILKEIKGRAQSE